MIRSLFRFVLRSALVVGAVSLFLRLFRQRQDTTDSPATPSRPTSPVAPNTTARPVEKTRAEQTPAAPVEETPSTSAAVGTEEPSSASDEAAWVAPVDGACPTTHPVKAKESSGIYHVPGGLSYDRTAPDRCYRDVTAAEADGYRQSKR